MESRCSGGAADRSRASRSGLSGVLLVLRAADAEAEAEADMGGPHEWPRVTGLVAGRWSCSP